jgi:glycosyltransferase involved in cell wall biosynthesis
MESQDHPNARRQRNIAVLGLSYPYRGGISHYTTLFVRELRKRHAVHFISLRRQYPALLFPGQSQFDTSEKKLEEPNERLIDTLNPLTWIKTARILRRAEPDLIVIQWWHPFFAPAFGTIVRLLPEKLRRRVCFVCHNVLPHERSPLTKLLTLYAFGAAGGFIVHSRQDHDDLRKLLPHASIRSGCHPVYSEFAAGGVLGKREARRTLALPETARVVLFFGLVRRYKGLAHLIEAMRILLPALECRLLIVGEFYDAKQPYLDLIESSGIAQSVTLIDQYVPNERVSLYFSAADVVALPYIAATQSGIVQIAFGLETPVITTNVGGLPEAVDHEKTGLIVDAGSPQQLAAAIRRFYAENLEEAFIAQIRKQRGRFDWGEEVRHVEAFLAESTA